MPTRGGRRAVGWRLRGRLWNDRKAVARDGRPRRSQFAARRSRREAQAQAREGDLGVALLSEVQLRVAEAQLAQELRQGQPALTRGRPVRQRVQADVEEAPALLVERVCSRPKACAVPGAERAPGTAPGGGRPRARWALRR